MRVATNARAGELVGFDYVRANLNARRGHLGFQGRAHHTHVLIHSFIHVIQTKDIEVESSVSSVPLSFLTSSRPPIAPPTPSPRRPLRKFSELIAPIPRRRKVAILSDYLVFLLMKYVYTIIKLLKIFQ